MITREEAGALLAHAPDYWLAPGDGSIENVQGATIAHVHEHANLRTMERMGESHSSADARLLAAAPDLARTVVALYDERDQHLNAEVVAGKMGVDGTDVLYVTIRVPLSRNRDFPMGATVRVLTQPKGAP